ncbi:hypothetical protein JRQ81_015430 [Phrynocephalus forsythii]|uniref:Uncharacterized protein n=1 Tax=Phrynocephalus forsythii TaxID=171643 RepID=A0A9Q1B1F3_9SAUR|nr:hypothetical protein JRQ81_015430 [Phrynocephalus forsythii]
MIRFLIFSFLVVVIDPNGTSGKPVHGDFRSTLQVDFSDAADPFNDAQTKRSSYPSAPDPEAPNPSDPSSMCHFTQESESESQITCRLHFTRNKFNFNPFGLRFGKRQEGIWAGERKQASTKSSKILQALLKLELGRVMGQCGEARREDC